MAYIISGFSRIFCLLEGQGYDGTFYYTDYKNHRHDSNLTKYVKLFNISRTTVVAHDRQEIYKTS